MPLKQWADPADGRLCEFSRPYKEVKARRVHPDGTGYLRGLNTFARLRPELADFLEHRFFKTIDNDASAILEMLNRDYVDFTDRSAWSRFIMSQLHRSPEGITRVGEMVGETFETDLENYVRRNYDELRTDKDPPTFEEFQFSVNQADIDQTHLLVLGRIMNSENVGTALNQMRWAVIRTLRSNHRLLTSDRPLVMTNGLKQSNAHIVIPISPVRIFAAAHTDDVLRQIDAKMQHGGGVQLLNSQIARQARKYVWGRDDSHLKFVDERLGDKAKWCPWE
jgi:hypothetical protein